ncbi:helix-turn-helix transcriptional regulator [Pseudomonas atacamensis]|uniref:Helix-turn-helix transcriptional regulator n=1 Tax=Pseudomonas iranensis TaxID=2745503 RepID=A0AAU7F3U0_9PSED
MSTDFASRLIRLRGDKNLTQQELGDAVGISHSQISRYEAGQAMPRKTVLRKLAEALGVPVEEFQKTDEESSLISVGLITPDGEVDRFDVAKESIDRLREIAESEGISMDLAFTSLLEWYMSNQDGENISFEETIAKMREQLRDSWGKDI